MLGWLDSKSPAIGRCHGLARSRIGRHAGSPRTTGKPASIPATVRFGCSRKYYNQATYYDHRPLFGRIFEVAVTSPDYEALPVQNDSLR